MRRIDIERDKARVVFEVKGTVRVCVPLPVAECITDIAHRMDSMDGNTDTRIGDVGLRRSGDKVELILLREGEWIGFPISRFDLGTLVRMVRQAASNRTFSGSVATAF